MFFENPFYAALYRPLAGFEVITYGRFWVIPRGSARCDRDCAECRAVRLSLRISSPGFAVPRNK